MAFTVQLHLSLETDQKDICYDCPLRYRILTWNMIYVVASVFVVLDWNI